MASGSQAIINALNEERTTVLDRWEVEEFDTIWEHEIADVPANEGNGITDKFFDYDDANVTRSGPDVQVEEGGHLRTVERGAYGAGKAAQAGAGGRIKEQPTGDQDAWVGYTEGPSGNGAGFGWDTTGLYCFDDNRGTRTKVYQSDWNRNKLNGNRGEGPDFDPTDGFIVLVDHAAYGHAQAIIRLGVKVDSDDSTRGQTFRDGDFQFFDAHSFNRKGDTMWDGFDFPIEWHMDGTEGDGNFIAATACHYQSELGRKIKRTNGQSWNGQQFNDGNNLAIPAGASWTYVMSLRKRDGWDDSDITPTGITVNADQNIEIQLTAGGSFGNTAYALPEDTSSTEAAVEYDLATYDLGAGSVKGSAASSFTTIGDRGERLWTTTVPGDKQDPVTTGAELDNVVLSGSDALALLARRATGNATVILFAGMRNGGNF